MVILYIALVSNIYLIFLSLFNLMLCQVRFSTYIQCGKTEARLVGLSE